MQTPFFNRKRLKIRPIAEREHGLGLSAICLLKPSDSPRLIENFKPVADRMIRARKKGKAVIVMIGAHVIRSGVQNYLIDLMRRGYIACLAMNGAGLIHDYEFALIGATTESVARYISDGRFGLWKETGRLNDIINGAYRNNPRAGMGAVVGRDIYENNYPYKRISLLAAGYKFGVAVTVHVGIGYDILHEHPNCNGAATGAASYNDFLKFAGIVRNLEGGMVMNFGSSVMAPEVFLKALSMARNLARQNKSSLKHFATLVCDLRDLPRDFRKEPSRGNPAYYFRPWKTMLVRTVAGGGESFYVKGKHADTLPALWTALAGKEQC